jgi:antitoxin (DNA-binding transcriptional repressor) of toxin-antitoxin stability system
MQAHRERLPILCKVCILHSMKATLTELRRKTSKVVRPVIHAGRKVMLTEHGSVVAQILPPPKKADRKALVELLRSMGPIELPSRK